MRAEADMPGIVEFSHRVPGKPLSDFVKLFWYWTGHPQPLARERILPMGSVELVIQLNNPKVSQSGMTGPRSESFLIERRATDKLLGVHFKPGGAFPFLGFPYTELHNKHITLAELWGERRAGRLLCLLNEAPTVEQKFRTLERWLLGIASQPFRHHPAVTFAVEKFRKDPGFSSSAKVADSVGFSQRRFIELFRNEVGMTPKLFCRVERFQHVIHAIGQKTEVGWIDLALDHGYSDQSHFNHDFREFSGLRPTEYLGLRTENHGHVRYPE
jgi:methylphosphotriester-DNA--protein-cysteine methyltransferase